MDQAIKPFDFKHAYTPYENAAQKQGENPLPDKAFNNKLNI